MRFECSRAKYNQAGGGHAGKRMRGSEYCSPEVQEPFSTPKARHKTRTLELAV